MARASGVDLSMLAEVGDLDPADETSREYERVADPKYLDQIRTEAKQFSNKLLSRQSGVARSAIMNFKKGRNTIKPRTLRKLTKTIHNSLQKKEELTGMVSGVSAIGNGQCNGERLLKLTRQKDPENTLQ
jgi:hypothetical protein